MANDNTITKYHTRYWQRRTYICGKLVAKYYGELDYIKDLQSFVREKYYDFTLYDAQITESRIRMNNEGPFPEFANEDLFPGPIHPNPLPCNISVAGVTGSYQILLHDVKLGFIDLNKHRLLHQQEDDEVFGTLEAVITGYILEHFEEQFETTEEIEEAEPIVAEISAQQKKLHKTGALTGRTKTERGYRWTEYWYSDRKTTYWGDPILLQSLQIGYASIIGWSFMILTGILFLIHIGAKGVMLLLVLTGATLLAVFFSAFLRAILWVGLALILLFAIMGSVRSVNQHRTPENTPIRDELTETSRQKTSWSNTKDSTILDSVIIHHRIWRDYDSGRYEGDITIRISDWRASAQHKNKMQAATSLSAYDEVLTELSAEDSGRLGGVYGLLDSVKRSARLDSTAFAKTVVSFVQDIPYSLILDGDCDADGYSDDFTRKYLSSAWASCEGHQRFGINSPVEFMATMKGDCDSRTLLLFTLLSHYGYRVAILSSEVYAHSMLGIALPLGGTIFQDRGRQYVMWETTSAGIRPGLIAPGVSDLRHWRISLTSKI